MATPKKKSASADDDSPDVVEDAVTAAPPHEEVAKADRADLQAKGQKAAGGEDKGLGDTSVPGSGVLVADVPPAAEPEQPEVDYDVVALDPLDSSEAWKEQERVPTGEADTGSDVKSGHRAGEDSKADPHAPETDTDRARVYNENQEALAMASASQTISSRPDGTLAEGLAPNSVVQVPEGIPAPINALSDAESVQDRVLYENWVNSEAEAFANEARIRFINATIAGKTLELSGDEDLGTPIDADDDDLGTTQDDGKLPVDDDIATTGAPLTPKGDDAPDADRDYS